MQQAALGAYDARAMQRTLSTLLGAGWLASLAPSSAGAACCELRKIDSDPAVAQIRACDPAAAEPCATWIFEGTLTPGQTAPVCVASEELRYEEWDAARGAWSPPVEARCEESGTVEL